MNLYAYVGNQPINYMDPEGTIGPLAAVLIIKGAAVATAYVGTKIAQWTVNYFAGHNAVSDKVLNDTFTKVAAISAVSAAVPAVKIGGTAAARMAATAAITNPQLLNNVADMVSGFTMPGPPSPPLNYYNTAAAGARWLIDNMGQTTKGGGGGK